MNEITDSYEDCIERIANLPELLNRSRLAFKWISTELAICNNVFQVGHKYRKAKMSERLAVMRLIGDLITKLEQEQAAIEALPSFKPEDTIHLVRSEEYLDGGLG
jgi:hypothetical protein